MSPIAQAKQAVNTALAWLPPKMDTPNAMVLLLATAMQESRCIARCQVLNNGGRGPARGLWQFERGGGVVGVMKHAASRLHMGRLCTMRGVEFKPAAVWEALETDDVLAGGAARLLYWTDPQPVPAIADVDGAWAMYLRVWRPGKPHPGSWAGCHRAACEAVMEETA